MISRWKPPTLVRGIAYTAGTLPRSSSKNPSRNYTDKKKEDLPNGTGHKNLDDPWAPIFDDISSAPPFVPSTRPTLPSRFFNSRPSPKTFFSSNIPRASSSHSGKREYGTGASGHGPPSQYKEDDGWGHIFEGVDDGAPLTSPGARASLPSPALGGTRRPKHVRPTMTAREISAFDRMFDMIFTAVSDKRRETSTTATVQSHRTAPHLDVPSSSPAIQPSPDPEPALSETIDPSAGDLFGRLRRQSNRMRQSSATAELLDRQKEETELCRTDQELLEWTAREVFKPELAPDTSSPASYAASPTYPHLLTHVMRTFRVRYNDPHTSLALFAYAKLRSIHSYVFGCTTSAYNELLEARWELDGDLKGIADALEEMRANGVQPDKVTRAFVERVRRELGEKFAASQEGQFDNGVWEVLEKVERLIAGKKKAHERGSHGDLARAGPNRKESRMEAKKKHWNEEWKTIDDGRITLGNDRLTLA